ncbi:hypothetical protein BZZ01_12410 [Nostocales cyanobacterium HT-58-2]|nr:hypothetical protein BZZ01_12410 [Nostocales cyanobacterium HT-58-2]
MKKFDLVIFDCDGVLVDSERITNTVFAKMLNELGLTVTLDDVFDTFVGNSMARCLEIIQDMLGKPVPDNFVLEYKRRITEDLRANLKPVSDINNVLDILNKLELAYCVASSGDHDKMQTTLRIKV